MRTLQDIDLKTVLVIDIETVSEYPNYQDLTEDWKTLWDKKAVSFKIEPDKFDENEVYKRAGIYSEFGKVVSIAIGLFVKKNEEWYFKVKAYSNTNEKELLTEFSDMLDKYFYSDMYRFCAHNGKDFDLPYLCRRMIINQVKLPNILDISGLKPWELKHLDTMDLWKFGDFKYAISLNLLAQSLGIPSPKDDIDGSMVGEVFWKENDLNRIDTYCKKDVVTTAKILMKLKGLTPFKDEHIIDN